MPMKSLRLSTKPRLILTWKRFAPWSPPSLASVGRITTSRCSARGSFYSVNSSHSQTCRRTTNCALSFSSKLIAFVWERSCLIWSETRITCYSRWCCQRTWPLKITKNRLLASSPHSLSSLIISYSTSTSWTLRALWRTPCRSCSRPVTTSIIVSFS